MLNTDDLRYHTEVGTGYSKDAMLAKAADEIDRLRAETDKRGKWWLAATMLVLALSFWIGSMIYGGSDSLREFLNTPLKDAKVGDIALLAVIVVVMAK